MRKLVFLGLFIFCMIVPVKALDNAFIEIDCNDNKLSSSKKISCSVNLIYENIYIDEIEMNYDSALDVEFSKTDGFSLTKDNNKLTVKADKTLFDEIMNSSIIFNFNISGNENIKDKESITFLNIKIKNNKDEKLLSLDNATYDFEVIKDEKLDDNCALDSISVDNVLIENFDKDNLIYNVTVEKNVIFIDAKRSSELSSATGLGNIRVKENETIEREIVVTAENGDTRIYKLVITNKAVKSDNNNIESLEIFHNNEISDLVFDSKKTNYDVSVNSDIDKITIKAILSDTKAIFVSKYGPRDVKLNYGKNKVEIKVQAENGDIKVYTLNITRKDERNNDTSLISLKINDENIILGDKNENYKVTLNHDIDRTKIEAIANDSDASVAYKDIDLVDGNNKVSIIVTAENGEKKEYIVDVIRLADEEIEENEEKRIFEKIEIANYDFSFNKNTYNYTLKVGKDVTKLDINILPKDIDSEILNNSNLENNSEITVNIHDDEGDKTYTILIQKDIEEDYAWLCYLIFGIGVVSLITSIIVTIKRNKK